MVNQIKTFYGFTFEQLHGCAPEELCDYMAAYAGAQVLEALKEMLPKEMFEAKIEKFLQIYTREVSTLFNKLIAEKVFPHMRKIYDTEEKFDDAADLVRAMGNIGLIANNLMNEVMTKVMND